MRLSGSQRSAPPRGRDRGFTEVRGLGRGGFGLAALVKDREGELRVMKIVDMGRLSRSEKEGAVNEARVLASLKHPYIIRYRESFLEDGALAIVMDYAEGGDLQDRITRCRFSRTTLAETQIVEWLTQAVLALKYVHDQRIIHRDLKSQNIFLSKQGQVRLGDFGISTVVESSTAVDQATFGTPYYLSPEVCARRLFGFASDMWALGVILFELGALRVPFEAPSLTLLLQKIMRLNAPTLPQSYSVVLRDLCKDLLCHDPELRPSALEVIRRPRVQQEISRLHRAARPSTPSARCGAPGLPGTPRSSREGTVAEPPALAEAAPERTCAGDAPRGEEAPPGAARRALELRAAAGRAGGRPDALGAAAAPPSPAGRGAPRPASRGEPGRGALCRSGAVALLPAGAASAATSAAASAAASAAVAWAWAPRPRSGAEGGRALSAAERRAGPRPEGSAGCVGSAGPAGPAGQRPGSPLLRQPRCRGLGPSLQGAGILAGCRGALERPVPC